MMSATAASVRTMTRSQHIANLRQLLAQVNEQLAALKDGVAEYKVFCWAYDKRYEFFFAERNLQGIARDIMFDWATALKSEAAFDSTRDRLKMGSARTALEGIARALELDIPEFVKRMQEEATENAGSLLKFQPRYKQVPEQGLDSETADKMLAEMELEIAHANAEIARLNTHRLNAVLAVNAVTRLAQLRVFFDDEAGVSQTNGTCCI